MKKGLFYAAAVGILMAGSINSFALDTSLPGPGDKEKKEKKKKEKKNKKEKSCSYEGAKKSCCSHGSDKK